jgi:DNA-binding SARP family transcriptional activator/tetratricopeptide (TPR) repeat protein
VVPVIEVSLLGPPRVERDRVRLTFETRKAVAVLALLSTTERARTRDALAEMLWPDNDPDHGRAALRRTLSDLRGVIGGELLESTRDHVRLVRGPGLAVDVHRFRELCRSGRADRAVELFRGDFLEGLAVRHAPDFEDWAQIEAAGLRRELTTALATVTRERQEAGELDAALEAARRWVATDPLHEPAHRALIRLYAATGDRAAALGQYRECVRTLSRELGVPPLSETKALYEEVNRGTYVMPAGAGTERPRVPAAAVRPPDPPLVGRAAALETARAVYDAVDDDGRVVLVDGEPGIGKTRFAEELLVSVRRLGGRVVVGRAYEGEAGLAYAPVLEALGSRLDEDDGWLTALDPRVRVEAARLLPGLSEGRPAEELPRSEGPGAESRFLAAVWETLVAAVSGEQPGALFLDDVQWADDATRTLLAYGLRRLAGRPLMLVLAWRPPYDGALRSAAGAVTREGNAVALHLDRLTLADVQQMLRAARPETEPEESRRLWETTEGVPLLLVEYLRDPGPDSAGALPSGAREVLRARLEPVSETGRQVLSAAAVLGRPFNLDTVRAVSGRTEEETVSALEEVVGYGLVVETADAYDFAHHLLRAVVDDDTSLARRRLLHRRAAGVPGTSDAAAARHLQMAGRDAEAAEAFWRAGQQARAVFANAEALQHLRAALAMGHPDRPAVLREVGDVQVLAGDYAGGLQSLEEAAATSRGSDLPVVEQRLGRLRHRMGDHVLAVAHLEAALGASPADGLAFRASVLVDLSQAVESCGDPARAESLAAQAREQAEAAGDPRAVGAARNVQGMLAASQRRHEEAMGHFRACLALAAEVGDPELEVAAMNNAALAHRSRGELDEALRLTGQALDLCSTIGDRHREAALHNNLADLLHDSGREEEAMAQLKRAVEAFADVGADPGAAEPHAGVWHLVRW